MRALSLLSLLLLLFWALPHEADGQCSGVTLSVTATSTYGIVNSPNYPLNYQNFQVCSWLFQADNSSHAVKLEILDISIEYHRECVYDYGELFDGYNTSAKSLGKFCGTSTASFISSGQYLYLSFISDYSLVSRGFQAQYRSGSLESLIDTSDSSASANIVPIIAGAVGGVVLVIVIGVIVFMCVKSSKPKRTGSESLDRPSASRGSMGMVGPQDGYWAHPPPAYDDGAPSPSTPPPAYYEVESTGGVNSVGAVGAGGPVVPPPMFLSRGAAQARFSTHGLPPGMRASLLNGQQLVANTQFSMANYYGTSGLPNHLRNNGTNNGRNSRNLATPATNDGTQGRSTPRSTTPLHPNTAPTVPGQVDDQDEPQSSPTPVPTSNTPSAELKHINHVNTDTGENAPIPKDNSGNPSSDSPNTEDVDASSAPLEQTPKPETDSTNPTSEEPKPDVNATTTAPPSEPAPPRQPKISRVKKVPIVNTVERIAGDKKGKR